MTAAVRLTTDARGIATLLLARPERKNAFDAALIAALTAAARAVPADARCAILAGEGDVFCAGADVAWMRSTVDRSEEENRRDAEDLAEMFAALDALPMPLVARVQGAAIGGGAGLAALAAVAVASRDATLGFSEVRLGILPAVISPYVVRRIGAARATALFVSGLRLDADRALALGLVDEVVEPEALDAAVVRWVEAVLAGSPRAVREAKRLARDVAGRTPAEARERTVDAIAQIRVSAEGQEGLRAFLEKRKPRWQA